MSCKFEYKDKEYTREGILDVIKSENVYVKGDVNKEAQWLKDKLGMSDHEISFVKGLIDNKAFGRFLQDGKILLSEELEIGSAYHEAMHRVFNSYLTVSDRIALRKEFYQRKDKDSILAAFKEKYPELNTDDLIEEVLAEEFRDYVLSDGKYKFPEKQKQGFFERLFNFLKKLVNNTISQEELFEKINKSGYKSAKLVGYASNSKDRKIIYKEKTLDELESQSLMKGLMYHFTNKLLDNNVDFYNFLTGDLKLADFLTNNTYGEPIIQTIMNDDNFDADSRAYDLVYSMYEDGDFTPLIKEFERYLNSFRIKLAKSNDIPDEEDKDDKDAKGDNTEASKSDLDIKASIEVDPYDSVSNTIKLILATLPKTKNGEIVRNELGLVESEDPQYVYAVLSQKLAGIPATNEAFIERLTELQGLFPFMQQIVQKVGLNANISNFNNNLESVNKLKLINDFIQAFAKTRNGYIITMISDDGSTIYRSDAEIENSVKKIRNNWQVAFNQRFINDLDTFRYKLRNNFKDKLEGAAYKQFAEFLGLNIPDSYLAQSNVKDALGEMFKAIKANQDLSKDEYLKMFTNIKSPFKISGSLDKIANEIAENDEFSNLQHYNSEGKLVYGISLNTNFSVITDGINYIVNKALRDNKLSESEKIQFIKMSLEEEFPHLFTPYSTNSIMLKRVLEGGNIVMNISDGVKDKSATVGKPTSDLSGPMRLIQVLNEALQGNYSFIQTGDRATVNSFNIVSKDNKQQLFYDPTVGADSYLDAFIGYLKDEVETHNRLKEENSPYKYVNANNDKYGLRFFSAVFTKAEQQVLFDSPNLEAELQKDVYKKKIKDFLKEKSDEYYNFLDKQGILQEHKGRVIGISNDLYAKLNLDTPQDIVFTSFINQVMANIEESKVFFGDLAAFKNADDIFKRLSQFNSTRKVSIDSQLNNDFVRMGNHFNKIKLSTGELFDYNTVRGNFNKFKEIVLIDSPTRESESISSELEKIAKESLKKDGFTGEELDKLAKTYVSKYLGYEEGDGASWVNIYFYKEMMLKSGAWDSISENIWRKVVNGENISTTEAIRLTMQKPNYVGPTEGNIFTATNRKTSYMPLIPQMIKGSVLEKIHEEMLKKGIEVLHLESAAKFGAKGTKGGKILHFYDDGRVNSEKWGEVINNLDWKYFGIQLDMNRESKEKISQATQATKNMLHNIFVNGIPRDYTGNNWEEDKKYWSTYSKDKKERLSKLAASAEEYNSLLNQLIESDIAELKETIGYKNGKITEWEEFKKIITREALSRNLSDNVLDSIDLFINNGKANKINTLSVKDKVEQLLMSVVTNRIIKQKRFGDALPQGSSKGLQKEGLKLEYDKNNEAYYSSELLSLRDSKGRSEFAVPLPNKLIDFVNNLSGNSFEEKLEEFNSKINTYMPEELRIFHGLRIPNQAYASNTAGIIKYFLPPTINTVIVPSSFVVQTGSDFDIDKLFAYFKEYYVKEGEIKEVKFFTKEEAYKRYKSTYEKLSKEKKEQELVNKLISAIWNDAENVLSERYKNLDKPMLSFEEFEYKPKRAALQNKLIDVTHQLLLNESNLRQLYTATDDSYLKEDLLQEILEAKGYPKNKDGKYVTNDDKLTITDIFLPTTSYKKFKDFYGSKAGLGMVARHIPNHALTQIKNIRIAPQYRTWFKDNGNTLAGLRESSGRWITDVLSAYLSGNVDAGKNPYLGKIGITKDTQDIATMLVRRGVSHKEVSFFLAQPVVQKYLEFRAVNESDVIKKTGRRKINKTTKENTGGLELSNADVAAKTLEFFGLTPKLEKDRMGNIITEGYLQSAPQHTLEDLKKGLSIFKDNFDLENEPKLTDSEKEYQFRILMEYINYTAQTRKFNEFINIANPDTNSDKNISEALTTIAETEIAFKAPDRFIENTADWQQEDVFGGILKPYYEAQKIKEAFKDVDLVYSNPLITMVIPRITKLLYPYSRKENKKTREKITKTVTDDIILRFVMKNIKNTRPDILSTISGDNSVAKRIEVIQVDKTHPLHNNKFIEKLVPLVNNTKIGDKEYDNFQLYDKKMQAFTINLLMDELLKIRNVDRALFNDIIIANFLQGGLGNSPFQLNQIIPADVYYGAISRVLEKFNVDMEDLNLFAKEYILNRTNLLQYGDEFDNWGNPPVYKIKDKDGNVIVHIKGEGSLIPKGNGYNVINYGTEKQTKINLFNEELQEPTTELTSQQIPTQEVVDSGIDAKSGFQGYKGGFEDKGKGTPQGDGKDKAMRKIANGFIGEYINKNSSTYISAKELSDKTSSELFDTTQNIVGGEFFEVVMLARNKEFSGKPLSNETKESIRDAKNLKVEFVVGDMPNVDSQFIDYLQEIGAKFTIYHTGNTPRIKLELENIREQRNQSSTQKPKEDVSFVFESNPELVSIGTPQQYSQYLESLNKPNTNSILQGNQQEQLKKFQELQERLNNKEFLEGAKSAFESSEELQNVYYEALGVMQNTKTKKTGLLDYFLNIKKDSVFQELIQIGENIGIGIEEYESDSPLQANWNGKNVTINKTYGKVTSNVIAHEVVHGILHTLTNNDYKNSKLNLKLEKFKTELFDYIEKKGINSLNLPPELRILKLDYIKKMSNQEIVTYAFTDSQFSEFLASIKTDAKLSNNESFWNKLINIFNTALKELGFTSKLDELIDILNTEVPLFNNTQPTSQQKQAALNAYTDYIARVSLGIVKNPSSGEYNYESKVKDVLLHGSPESNLEKFNATWKRGFYATAYEQMAKGAGGSTNWDKVSKIYRVILNIKNPRIELMPSAIGDMERNPISYIKEKGYDSFIINNQSFKNNRPNEEVIVFEPEQIHILGSKQDIEGFKKFVEQPINKETKDKKSYMRVASPRISAVTTISGSLQDFKKAVGLTKKQIDTSNQGKINKEVEKYNTKNGTSYYVKYKQVGQSNLVTYEILNKSPLDKEFDANNLANDLGLDKKCD